MAEKMLAEKMLDMPMEKKEDLSKKKDESGKKRKVAGPASSKKSEPPRSQNVADMFTKMENYMSQSLRAMEQRQNEKLQNVSSAVVKMESNWTKFRDEEKKKKAEEGVEKDTHERNDWDQEGYEHRYEDQQGDDQYYDDQEEYDQYYEDEEEKEEEVGEKEKNYELEFFEDSKSSVLVSEDQTRAWKRFRCVSEEFDNTKWQKMENMKLVRMYTSHPSAKDFLAHEKDSELAVLRFESARMADKAFHSMEKMAGATGAVMSKVLEVMQQLSKDQVANMKDFKEEDERISFESLEKTGKVVETIRAEAAASCEQVADALKQKFLPKIRDGLKLSAMMFNRACAERRKLYVKNTTKFKQAGARLNDLQPSRSFLFGGKVPSLTTSLRDEFHLTPRAGRGNQFQGNRGGFYRGYRSRGRGFQPRARGRGFSKRGATKND